MPEMPVQQPQPAGAAQPGQPPFGTSPAVGPTPNAGYEAAGLQKLGMALRLLEQTVPLLGAASEPGKEVLRALNGLSKHIPPGTVTPAAEKNQLQQMALQQAQRGPMIAKLREAAMQQQQAQPGVGA